MSLLKSQLIRQKEINPSVDVDHIMKTLESYSSKTWIRVTGDDFAVFQELYEYNLAMKMIIPKWHNGNFTGNEIYFKYSHALDYK